MNQEEIWQQFLDLPIAAQKEVATYIAFLKTRYEATNTPKPPVDWGQEPVVGMWADREDMEDSNA